MAEMEQDGGDPAAAFEALRHEVAGLRAELMVARRAVEALPDAWAVHQPPDYGPSFTLQEKLLRRVVAGLTAVEHHPALQLTPGQHQAAIAQAGAGVMREAVQKLEHATQETQSERQQLAGLIGTVWEKREQRLFLLVVAATVFICTFTASPLIWRSLPFGLSSWSASVIMQDTRWGAGWDLLQAADPGAEQQAAVGFNLLKINRKELMDCAAAAAKAQRDQRCTITVPVKW